MDALLAPPPAADPGREAVSCGRFFATLSLRSCLLRASAVWASGRRRGAPKFPSCASCVSARLRRRRSPWFVAPAPWDAPEVLPQRARLARVRWQRDHEARWNREDYDEDSHEDPLSVVAAMTPDDGIGVDVG